MKHFTKMTLMLVIAIGFLMSTVVLAQGWGGNGRKGAGYSQNKQGYGGPGRVLREAMYNARIEVLAGLSDLTQDEIKAKLQYKPMWAVLDEAKVDFPTFQKKMQEKAKVVVAQAVSDGTITQTQGDQMLERMENGPMRGMGRKGCGRGKGRGYGGGF